MSSVLLAVFLILVLACSLGALIASRPLFSIMAMAAAGLCLALVFLVLQAPDVAVAQLLFGTAFPVILHLFALRATVGLGERGRSDGE